MFDNYNIIVASTTGNCTIEKEIYAQAHLIIFQTLQNSVLTHVFVVQLTHELGVSFASSGLYIK